jgi:hypothetical protein
LPVSAREKFSLVGNGVDDANVKSSMTASERYSAVRIIRQAGRGTERAQASSRRAVRRLRSRGK